MSCFTAAGPSASRYGVTVFARKAAAIGRACPAPISSRMSASRSVIVLTVATSEAPIRRLRPGRLVSSIRPAMSSKRGTPSAAAYMPAPSRLLREGSISALVKSATSLTTLPPPTSAAGAGPVAQPSSAEVTGRARRRESASVMAGRACALGTDPASQCETDVLS